MDKLEQPNKNDITVYLSSLNSDIKLGLNILDDDIGEMPVISKREYLESFNKDESRLALKQFVDNFEPVDIDTDIMCNIGDDNE